MELLLILTYAAICVALVLQINRATYRVAFEIRSDR
jgi:hypothetical protein